MPPWPGMEWTQPQAHGAGKRGHQCGFLPHSAVPLSPMGQGGRCTPGDWLQASSPGPRAGSLLGDCPAHSGSLDPDRGSSVFSALTFRHQRGAALLGATTRFPPLLSQKSRQVSTHLSHSRLPISVWLSSQQLPRSKAKPPPLPGANQTLPEALPE